MNAELEELKVWLAAMLPFCQSVAIDAKKRGNDKEVLKLSCWCGAIVVVQDKINQIEEDNAAVDSIVRWLEE